MSDAVTPSGSLRVEQAEASRLAWAFAISMAVHLVLFGAYYSDHRYHWSQYIHWPKWLKPVQTLVQLLKKKETLPLQPPPSEDVPLMFVDVSSAQATAEPPKNPKFYSDKNSKAANPEIDKPSDAPKINGTQTQVVKTEDVPREKFEPLHPSAPVPPPQAAQPAQEEQRPKPSEKPGDLTMGKPEPKPEKKPGQAPHQRPRLLAQVMPQARENRLPGEQMRQEGGVSRHLEIASLDAKGTPLGDYDRALIDAIANCWYKLLDAQQYASDYRGKVELQFHLYADGRVADLNVTENTTGEDRPALLCQLAVDTPSPFLPFPPSLRTTVPNPRSIQFTFYYNW
jgi:outer membrane biosynthesis protein TonB